MAELERARLDSQKGETEGRRARRRVPAQLFAALLVIMLMVGGLSLLGGRASAALPASGLASPPSHNKSSDSSDSSNNSGKPQVSGRNDAGSGQSRPSRPVAVLYDQYNNPGLNATGSQNFEPANDPFDDELADDFVVPAGQTWDIDGVDADGQYFNCTTCGNPTSINVVFYTSVVSGTYTVPGAAVASRANMAYSQPTPGEFFIAVSPVVSLAPGTYYVSVQANMDFPVGGQWGWANRTVQSNGLAAWRNPGGGFGTGCTNWGRRDFCVGQPTEPDQMFRINGNIQGQPTATPTSSPTATPVCPQPAGWVAGPTFTPGPAVVRAVGVYYPPNARFYSMGGRSSDAAGNDYLNPREYTQGSPGTWAIKVAAFPDNQVNNMACVVLDSGGTDYIYCVGGSAAGAVIATGRVVRYDPIADVMTTEASDPWPPGASNTLPGGFAVSLNKLYILGGFTINTAMTNQIWEFDPNAPLGSKWTLRTATLPVPLGYIPAATIGALIYTGGGSTFTLPNVLADSNNSYVYNPVGDIISPIAAIPRVTGETRGVNVNNELWVLGGGRTAPNPSNQVDIYDPDTNTWRLGLPFATPRRNFPADSDGVRVWLVGGYTATNQPLNTMQIYRPETPCAALIGHVTWQGRPVGYDVLNQLPITLTLRMGATVATYPDQTTDPRGTFSVTVSTLPSGTYTWWAKGTSWLATSGSVNLTGAPETQQEMGLQRAGDVNNDNLVDITDFSLLRASFGRICGDPAFNHRADFTGECLVDITDFGLLRGNFGQAGPPPP